MPVSPQVWPVLGGTECPAPPLVRSGWLNEPFGPRACSCGYRLDCLLAGPFTAATGFCADAAMLMLAGMALAFFRADAAGLGARFEGGADHSSLVPVRLFAIAPAAPPISAPPRLTGEAIRRERVSQ